MKALAAIIATLLCACAPAERYTSEPIYDPEGNLMGMGIRSGPVSEIDYNVGGDCPNVAITRRAFDARFPQTVRRAPMLIPPSVIGGRCSGMESMAVADAQIDVGETFGIYDHRTHICYFVCEDIEHPTAWEWLVLAHEVAHRVEHLQGWAAAAPLWVAIWRVDPSLLTHPDIRERLKHEGLIP